MNNIIPNGTQVLIFKGIEDYNYMDCIDKSVFAKGIIAASTQKEYIPRKDGSIKINLPIYTIIGEDGKTYECPRCFPFTDGYYMKTITDHIRELLVEFIDFVNQIDFLNYEIEKYNNLINSLIKMIQETNNDYCNETELIIEIMEKLGYSPETKEKLINKYNEVNKNEEKTKKLSLKK